MSEPTFIENAGSCIATAQAISGPGRIRWMLRTPSAVASDSGWRFYSDDDDEENVAHTTNMRVLDFNQVAALEPLIVEVYHEPVDSDFELVTLPDGARQIRDSSTGRVVAGPAAGPAGAEGGSGTEAVAPVAASPVPSSPESAAGAEAGIEQLQAQAPATSGSAEAAAPTAESASASAPWVPSAPAPQAVSEEPRGDARPDAEQDALIAASASWLRPAVQGWLATKASPERTVLLSEFFGSDVLIPLAADGTTLAGFSHQGTTVIPLHTSRQGALAWQQRLGLTQAPRFTVLNGDEALRKAFDEQGAASVVLDPVEAGVEIRSDDAFLAGFTRNGRLKRLVRSGDRAAIMNYLTSAEAYGVYLYRAEPGQPQFPVLVTRQGGGEREFALFSSSLEVFRYQGDGSAAQVSVDWIRQNLAEDMFLCIDPGAEGGFIEFSPAELSSYGFRRV